MKTRRSAIKKTKRLFVVATEGAETEPIYFQEFHPNSEGGFRLKILGNPKHKSRPVEIVQRLLEYERRERPGPDTEYWAIIDRDVWPDSELQEAWKLLAVRDGYHLALSNPCFELWRWLHLRPNRPFSDRHECLRSLAREWPDYAKSSYDAAALMPFVTEAITRAAGLEEDPGDAWPAAQGTRVYRLVENLR